MSSNKFFFSLKSIQTQKNNGSGSYATVTSKETPGLVNSSLANLTLNKNSVLEPIWHPNAHKIGYCLQGKHLVTMRTPEGVEVFTLQKGEMFFVPQGVIHHIENIGDQASQIVFCLNNALPETMFLSKAVESLSDSVFNATFKTRSNFVDKLKHTKHDLLKNSTKGKDLPDYIASRFKFDIQDSVKGIYTTGGYLQNGTKRNLTVLQGLSILGFGLNPKGFVEPHWHTNAGELIYIVKGKTKITLLSPDGHVDEWNANGGEGVFAPASYFHNIENVGSDMAEVIAFFNHAEPDYIGIGEVMGAYSNDVLASVFNVDASYFQNFAKPHNALVIVPT